jgi:hypothetical protein
MPGTPQDKLWDRLIRQVQGLPKDAIVEIIDYSTRPETAVFPSDGYRAIRRVLKWPMQRPRRAAW